MLLLTHLYFAKKLKAQMGIENVEIYLLGTTIPDIRYIIDRTWQQTHRNPKQLVDYVKSPKDADFLKGYKVHMQLDSYPSQFGLYKEAKKRFPKLVRPVIYQKIVNILFEIYYLENHFKQSDQLIIGKHNSELTNLLGLTAENVSYFTESLNQILKELTVESIEEIIFKNDSLRKSWKLKVYRYAGKLILKNRKIKNYLLTRLSPLIANFEKNFLNKNNESAL